MVKKIISERKRIWKKCIVHEFSFKDGSDGGYSFDVDCNGNPILPCKEAEENYQYCLSHPDEIENESISDKGWWYTELARAICEMCGREIVLEGDSMCECGQWHNQFGQSLLPPEHWEELWY